MVDGVDGLEDWLVCVFFYKGWCYCCDYLVIVFDEWLNIFCVCQL